VTLRGAKKALKTEPTELVCHPSKALFVAFSETAAIVGDTAEIKFALEGGAGSGGLRSPSFHPTLSRMLAIRSSEILCWDVSSSQGFRLLASVQVAAPPEGVYFLPGMSPYFCSLAIDTSAESATRVDVSPWYLDESEEQPLQPSAAMNSSTLAELAAHGRGTQSQVSLKQLLFPHTVLPVVVAIGRTSFAVVRCIDRVCPTTVMPSAATSHLSLKHLEAELSGEQVLPEKLRFMNGRKVWTYEQSEQQLCADDKSDGTLTSLTLSAKATVCSTIERQDGPGGESILATACMEFGGGTRAAFFQTPGAEIWQRSCKDAALVDTTHWPGSQSPGVAAAVISEDGMSLNFEGKHALASGCAGPHLLGCPVSRVFCTPFCNGAALLFVDSANQVRFSRNRSAKFTEVGSQIEVPGTAWSDWSVWNNGPGLRLHGDENVISAAWQEGSGLDGDVWLPVLALLTSRRVVLLSHHLEVMAHAEIEPGNPSPLGVPSGIWCGVVFLYTTSAQIRWLALDGTTGALVSLQSLNATLCAVTQSNVTVLCPDGHRSFVHSIPVGLHEPLALGWVIAFKLGQVSLAKAVQHIQFRSKEPGSEWTVSASLLQAIAVLSATTPAASGRVSTHERSDEEAALQTLLHIGLEAAFDEKVGEQFPLETRLSIAVRCGAYRLGYEALRREWINQSEPSLSSTSSGLHLGRLLEQLAGVCRGAGEPDIERQCRLLLGNQWDPLHYPSGTGSMTALHETSTDEKPKRFADVLDMQARRLPSATPLPSAEIERPAVHSPTTSTVPVEVRRSWEAMAGVRVQAHENGGLTRRAAMSGDAALQLDMANDIEEATDSFEPMPTSALSGSPPLRLDADLDDDVSTDGVGMLRSAGWEIDRFSSSDDDDDDDDLRVGRGRKITIEIKQPSATVSRSSVSAILEGATSVPLSTTDSPGNVSVRSGIRLGAPPRTMSTLAPPPRTMSTLAPPPRTSTLPLPPGRQGK
jgi:hypothetical protein